MPHKFDEYKQAEFIGKYEAFKFLLKDDEPLLLMDAVHPTQATKITCGWIKIGVDKPIETTGSRTRLNIIGAIRLGYLSDTIVDQYKIVNGDSIGQYFSAAKQFKESIDKFFRETLPDIADSLKSRINDFFSKVGVTDACILMWHEYIKQVKFQRGIIVPRHLLRGCLIKMLS